MGTLLAFYGKCLEDYQHGVEEVGVGQVEGAEVDDGEVTEKVELLAVGVVAGVVAGVAAGVAADYWRKYPSE